MSEHIPGYDMGEPSVAESPVNDEEFEHLKASVLFTEEDERYLRMAGEVLDAQIDDVLDLWYDFVGDHDFLLYYFTDGDGHPDEEYLERVKARFGQWIRDTCNPPYDREWLDYQEEIGLRHHRAKKNVTDDADAVPHIHLRYLIAFIYPITATIREFLQNSDHTDEEVDAMYHAWFKSVTMQVALWSHPYVEEGDW